MTALFRTPRLDSPLVVPTGDVEIDQTHDLASALYDVILFARRSSVAGTISVTPTAAVSPAPTAIGPGLALTGSGGVNTNLWIPNTQPFTVALLLAPSGATWGGGNPRFFATDHADSNHRGFQFFYYTSFGEYDLGFAAGGLLTAAPPLIVGHPMMIAGSWDGTTAKTYLNGVLQGSASVVSYPAGGYPLGFGYGVGYNGDYISARLIAAFPAARALSDGEQELLAAEPFAMLRPRVRRAYYGVVAGGSGALTGTSAATSSAAATLAGLGALAGGAAATSSAIGTISSSASLTGTAAATTSASGALIGTGALTGSATATSVAAGAISGIAALTGTSAASSATSATLSGLGTLAGTTTASSTATGTISAAGSGAMSGTSAASSAAVGALAGTGVLTGTAATTASAAGALSGLAPLSGSAVATSASAGVLSGIGALSGSAFAQAAATGALTNAAAGSMSGAAAAVSSASATLSGIGALTASAVAIAAATGTLVGFGPISGAAAAMSSATGTLTAGTPFTPAPGPRITVPASSRLIVVAATNNRITVQ